MKTLTDTEIKLTDTENPAGSDWAEMWERRTEGRKIDGVSFNMQRELK